MLEEGKNNKELIIGIDDAGRGPVIGPMCLAGVLIPKEIEAEFRRAGIKDSKLLSPKKREELAKIIKEIAIDFNFQLLSPVEIDTGLGMGMNLNEVEAIVAASIINNLVSKLDKSQKKDLIIIIDCPSNNPSSWINTLMNYVKDENKSINIRTEHKADFHYPSVSAASIIAKTIRDAEIKKLKEKYGDFGSGYPSDPATKKFLEENVEKLQKEKIFRESWQTFQTAKNKKFCVEIKKTKQEKLFG